MADWQKMLSTVAPWIGAAATGGVPALVGMAAVQVGQAFGTDVKATTDAIAQAIGGATPDQLLALKTADNDFAEKMQALGFQNAQALEQIAANDRDSARKMHTAVRDWSTPVLSYMIMVAFFSVLYLILSQSIDVPASMRDVVMMMIGTLTAAFTQVLNFRFGTSAGSKDKTEILKGLRP
jgi:hypothetical protein